MNGRQAKIEALKIIVGILDGTDDDPFYEFHNDKDAPKIAQEFRKFVDAIRARQERLDANGEPRP